MAGDPASAAGAQAAARLFEEYGEQLYRFCLSRLGSREEAEDAVQSTFLRVHRAIEDGVVPEYEAAWLYTIAHNVCLTRRSALARGGSTVPFDEETPLAAVAPEGPREELWRLPDALEALAPKVRQAILLREWRGLAYTEIAAAMDTSVSAVETLIFRGRRDLAASLRAARPRRRPARLVDLVAAFLGPKLAAGAALVVLGSAGVGTAVELDRHAPPRPQHTRAAITAPIAAAVVLPATQRPARHRPVHHATTATRRHSVSRVVHTTTAAPPSAPATTVPAVAPPPQPPSATTSRTTTTTASTLAAPPVTTPAVVTVADVLTVTVPSASPPTPTQPTAPTVSVPSLPGGLP